jgi:hypothetical protein
VKDGENNTEKPRLLKSFVPGPKQSGESIEILKTPPARSARVQDMIASHSNRSEGVNYEEEK